MNNKKVIAASAALGLAATRLVSAPAAHAEPVSPSVVVVGSDTLQDVLNALANGTNITGSLVRSQAGDSSIGSFDATGSDLVQTKPNGVRFGRPNGSSDGQRALSRSIDGLPYKGVTITGQVDITRSSSGPGTLANPTGPLRFIPFGRDALSYAHTAGANAAFDNISQAALKSLFECTATTIGGVTAVPVIPQAGSGTRADFMTKVGLTDASLGACVVVGQEHDTQTLANGTTPFPANGVTAMSAAQWVAQNTGAGIDRRGATAKIGSPIAGTPAVREQAPRWFRTPPSTRTPHGAATSTSSSRKSASPSAMPSTTPASRTWSATLLPSWATPPAASLAGRFREEEVRLPRPFDHGAHPLQPPLVTRSRGGWMSSFTCPGTTR